MITHAISTENRQGDLRQLSLKPEQARKNTNVSHVYFMEAAVSAVSCEASMPESFVRLRLEPIFEFVENVVSLKTEWLNIA